MITIDNIDRRDVENLIGRKTPTIKESLDHVFTGVHVLDWNEFVEKLCEYAIISGEDTEPDISYLGFIVGAELD